MRKLNLSLASALCLTAAVAVAQTTTGTPGSNNAAQVSGARPDTAALVQAGTYNVDPAHTQVIWSVDHMGFSRLSGMVGSMSGTLEIDPARLAEAKVVIDIPLSGLTVTSSGFATHLQTPDLFDAAKFPAGRFVSRAIAVRGQQARITGDLTLRGMKKPIVLEAQFYGAGPNPMSKAQTVGFSARGQLKRSDFGLGYAVPAVSDVVELQIAAAFEKSGT